MEINHIKTISLVLGSGGARGYAHIGVIEAIEKKGYEIKSIAGSSMGALIGGLYAVGKLEEYKQWVLNLNYYDIYQLLSISLVDGGLVDAEKVFDKIKNFIGDVNIEDLPIQYKAVATDLNTQEPIIFEKGKLIDAIRASIAVPTIFVPVYKDNRILVDGGVLNPLPINLTSKDQTDLKIAVNLDANIKNKYIIEIPKEQLTREELLYSEFNKLLNQAETLLPKELLDVANKYRLNWRNEKTEEIHYSSKHDISSILRMTLDTAQTILSKYYIQNNQVDILIEISRESCSFYEFTKAYQMIEIGKLVANEVLK
ncbi:MAG: patatin-like phospholipase family protein [Arcobacter sp.]|jgi:NTE family protein|uniref:patatin-like phospholipase family protein n=1 Tax=Arcobacter sp. TaxID=1872629 RepID=UPI003D09036A